MIHPSGCHFLAPSPEVQAKMAMLKGTASSEQVASFVSLEEMALELATARGAFYFSFSRFGDGVFWVLLCHHFFGWVEKNKLTQKIEHLLVVFSFSFQFHSKFSFFLGGNSHLTLEVRGSVRESLLTHSKTAGDQDMR